MEDLLAADARPFKGKTDYEDYVRRIAKEARERALRLMIDDEAEETDDESEEELVDDEAPRMLEEFIEGDSEEEETRKTVSRPCPHRHLDPLGERGSEENVVCENRDRMV